MGLRKTPVPDSGRPGGAPSECISYAHCRTSLGEALLGATDRGLCFLQFGAGADQLRAQLQAEFPRASLAPMTPIQNPLLVAWLECVDDYLAGRILGPQLPLDIRGTAFQRLVWNYLVAIPAGQTRCYAEVARAIGRPRAARAVAGACASNRLALVIPCHRVIRGDGSLGGYRWGLERKRALLALEAQRADAEG